VLAFGAQGFLNLPYGARFTASTELRPAVDDWTRDDLLRSEAAPIVPMLEWVAFKASMLDSYDSTLAADTERNEFTTTFGLSLVL
jgi:hypothetical protein